jgi:hypothetical protein
MVRMKKNIFSKIWQKFQGPPLYIFFSKNYKGKITSNLCFERLNTKKKKFTQKKSKIFPFPPFSTKTPPLVQKKLFCGKTPDFNRLCNEFYLYIVLLKNDIKNSLIYSFHWGIMINDHLFCKKTVNEIFEKWRYKANYYKYNKM